MSEIENSTLSRFFLRRLMHVGKLRRGDVKQIEPSRSDSSLTMMLDKFTYDHRDFAYLSGKTYLCNQHKTVPVTHEHSANSILSEIIHAPVQSIATGFGVEGSFRSDHQDSIVLLYDSIRAKKLPDQVDFHPLLQSLIKKNIVRVKYVNMKPGSRAMYRVLLPVSLHHINGRLSIAAYDLNSLQVTSNVADYPLKEYVLTRMLEIEQIPICKRYKGIVSKILNSGLGQNASIRYRVTLNSQLTPDQLQAIRFELGMDESNEIALDPISYFHFKQQYASSHSLESIDHVVPIVTHLVRIS